MQSKGKMGNLEAMIKQDLQDLWVMCNGEDENFFRISDKYRKTEDYVRLAVISLALNLRGAALRIMGEAERKKRNQEIIRYLMTVKNDYHTIGKWVDDFISAIREPDYKQVALEIWKEKKADIHENAFDISQITGIKRRSSYGPREN